MNKNAKNEFPALYGDVICSHVRLSQFKYRSTKPATPSPNNGEFSLKQHHTKKEFDEFLDKLDFDYEAGYGSQNLFGVIWCVDGSYYGRDEYDGAESWELHIYPEIPEKLEDKERERQIKIDKII